MERDGTTTLGYYRPDDSVDWSAARFTQFELWFDLTPAPPSTAGQVPVERIELREISGVDQVGEQSGDLSTIEIRRSSGSRFEVAVPQAFTDALCHQLRRMHSTEPTRPATTVPVPLTPSLPTALQATPAPLPQPSAAITQPAADSPSGDGLGRRQRRRRLALQSLAVLVVAGLLGTIAGLFAQSQSQRDRAELAESELSDTRTRLDQTAAEFSSAQDQLTEKQAELDAASSANTDLTTRVSELGNEKAQVQDERNAAEELSRLGADAAAKMTSCADLLAEIIGYVLSELYTDASLALDIAAPICQTASTAVGAFQAATE